MKGITRAFSGLLEIRRTVLSELLRSSWKTLRKSTAKNDGRFGSIRQPDVRNAAFAPVRGARNGFSQHVDCHAQHGTGGQSRCKKARLEVGHSAQPGDVFRICPLALAGDSH